MTDSRRPEDKREELRQKELQKPSSSIHGSNLADSVGGLSWKVTGIIILLLMIAAILYFTLR